MRSLRIQGSEPPTALKRDRTANQIPLLANVTGSFKGLPQEIVDEILEYLEDHRWTLNACSLTCKGLFLSARPIIHRRLYVVGPTNRYKAANHPQLSTLSAAAQCGLSHYTRKLTIRVGVVFTPASLRPHLPQFQTFALLTSITLHRFDPHRFIPVFERYFGHLAQQMRSLEFINPPGSQDDMMYFICQFPNLENLGFNPFPYHNIHLYEEESNSSTIQSSPTLGGILQVTSTNHGRTNSLESLARLPSGLRFRSIEFLHCIEIDPNIIIQECTSTLQSLTHVFHNCQFFLEMQPVKMSDPV